MAIDKIQSESINLADNFAFTGTVSGAGGTNTPSFFAYLGSVQTVSASTHTTVALNQESFDTASGFNTSTYKYTIPSGQGGKYYLTAQVRRDNFTASSDRFNMYVLKNNSTNLMSVEVSGDSDYGCAGNSTIVSLSAGDVVHLLIYFTNDSNGGLLNGAENTYLGAYKIIE